MDMEFTEWFQARTFNHRDYSDIAELVRLKEKQNLAISLCLPTLNEEKTISEILGSLKTALVEQYPLLDEIALIDSRSTDKTVELARELGVDVYFDDEILVSEGPGQGKGEALWKSLHALSGDIIIWIDSDIKNIHPRFVHGLVGPLLERPEISFIKGFYQRPITFKKVQKEAGGGRVTEILTRPFFNMFYPELTGFIQPLAGEYGGRREVLESVPFFTGYGVETGLLVDVWKKYGLSRMAQSDLDKRVHHNQSLGALGKMSFGIMQAIYALLEEDHKLELKTDLNKTFRTVKHVDHQYSFHSSRVEVKKRPPMITIPEYVARHGKKREVRN
jgi:glucosyl-3-phosphoglycerate synthase